MTPISLPSFSIVKVRLFHSSVSFSFASFAVRPEQSIPFTFVFCGKCPFASLYIPWNLKHPAASTRIIATITMSGPFFIKYYPLLFIDLILAHRNIIQQTYRLFHIKNVLFNDARRALLPGQHPDVEFVSRQPLQSERCFFLRHPFVLRALRTCHGPSCYIYIVKCTKRCRSP